MVTLAMTLGNGSGTDFQASQCFSMDLDTAADADADVAVRCVQITCYILKSVFIYLWRWLGTFFCEVN